MKMEYVISNDELAAAIEYTYKRTGTTARGTSMQAHLEALLDIQKRRARLVCAGGTDEDKQE